MNKSEESQKKKIIKENLKQKRKIYEYLLRYIEGEFDYDESNFHELQKSFKDILQNPEEIKHFLRLLLSISNNHHREVNFIKKIKKMLQKFFRQMQKNDKQTLSNLELFEIFKSNKLIVLFLLQEQIIKLDEFIILEMLNYQKEIIPKYCYFFILEINEFINKNESFSYLKEKISVIEDEIKTLGVTSLEDYEEKRLLGENDSYICSLIRNDSIEEFISYVESKNIMLSSFINPSIYETNIFLLEKEKTTLIEYAVFYGSIQIVNYLFNNKVEINETLWEYGIHSNNPCIINKLEENFKVNTNQLNIFLESIKCHHNDIAEYLKNNIFGIFDEELNTNENIISTSFKYSNYIYIPTMFDNNYGIFYLNQYQYSTIEKLILQVAAEKINSSKINKSEILLNLQKEGDKIEINESLKNLFTIYFLLMNEKTINDEYFENCVQLIEMIIPPKINSININAFFGCQSLTQISIPSSVEKIFPNAFRNCIKLKNVVIPSSVTFIGKNAFDGCESIENITIPLSIKSIGAGVFYHCTSLKTISLPSSLDKIEGYLFFDCKSLSKIFIPSSVKSIGNSSFKGCLSLKEVIFENPSLLESINTRAFLNCSSLEWITLPSSLKSIDKKSFENCSSMRNFSIPASVNYCGEDSFNGCPNIIMNYQSKDDFSILNKITNHLMIFKENAMIDRLFNSYVSSINQITLSPFIKSINFKAFNECSRLTDIKIPSSVTEIGDYAFAKCSSLAQVSFEIPSYTTSIGNCAFLECSSLTQITIPSSVTSIGKEAFYKCSSLTQITIPYSVKQIGDKCFSGIKSLTITGDIKKILENMFKKCSSLEQISILSPVTSIRKKAFYQCSSLTQITIPSSITSIRNEAFYHCIALTQIIIPSSVTSIGYSAFYKCSSLTQIIIPSSITKIGNNAFYQCSSLTQITIPSFLKTIGNSAFFQCSSLKQISIENPSSLTTIGESAFDGCTSLKEFLTPSSVTMICQYAFSKCSSLSKISIPSSLTVIENSTFDYCSSLTNISLPRTIKSIGNYAFYGCSGLKQISIPYSVSSIGDFAFYECSSLNEVFIPSSLKPTGKFVFPDSIKITKI